MRSAEYRVARSRGPQLLLRCAKSSRPRTAVSFSPTEASADRSHSCLRGEQSELPSGDSSRASIFLDRLRNRRHRR